MDAATIALMLAAFGANFGWVPVDSSVDAPAEAASAQDGAVEPVSYDYTIQLGADDLEALREGVPAIVSHIPDAVQPLRSVRVVVGSGAVERRYHASDREAEHQIPATDGPSAVAYRVAKPVVPDWPRDGWQGVGSVDLDDISSADETGQRHTVYQSPNVYTPQLQEGFSRAAEQTQAAQNWALAQEQRRRSIGSELQNGAQKLFEGTGRVLNDTGEVIQGTVLNTRDGLQRLVGAEPAPAGSNAYVPNSYNAAAYDPALYNPAATQNPTTATQDERSVIAPPNAAYSQNQHFAAGQNGGQPQPNAAQPNGTQLNGTQLSGTQPSGPQTPDPTWRQTDLQREPSQLTPVSGVDDRGYGSSQGVGGNSANQWPLNGGSSWNPTGVSNQSLVTPPQNAQQPYTPANQGANSNGQSLWPDWPTPTSGRTDYNGYQQQPVQQPPQQQGQFAQNGNGYGSAPQQRQTNYSNPAGPAQPNNNGGGINNGGHNNAGLTGGANPNGATRADIFGSDLGSQSQSQQQQADANGGSNNMLLWLGLVGSILFNVYVWGTFLDIRNRYRNVLRRNGAPAAAMM
ncbi:hypothetical protein Mal64_04960 [Pseudobythopirellula maris]|uniref:Uncharacterized protein n=1 Tax=Pseudobythopirellula maris TaxID=2527991 RepID=A0A5C5ZV71_9BACT|nr:hypothetical protein [Pseudobythopirellula maris]TWT90113.1 hypothetical protein Mal64_04960 [Pseudobythopirellula maris]